MSNSYTKKECQVLDYVFDWSSRLESGETISSYTLTADGVTIDSDTLINSDTQIQYFVSGGTSGNIASVYCEIVTSDTREDCATAYFTIIDDGREDVTPNGIIAFYPQALSVDTSVIQTYINLVSEQDDCMQNAGMSDDRIRAVKLNAVSYLLFASSEFGNVTSMRSPTGESISFKSGAGLGGNQFGKNVLMLDSSGCVVSALENAQNERFFVSVGGGCCQ